MGNFSSVTKLMHSRWCGGLFILESPGTQHGLVSASIVGVGEHIYDGIWHRRYEESDVAYDGDYLEAVVEVVHVTLSGVLHGPNGNLFYGIAEVPKNLYGLLTQWRNWSSVSQSRLSCSQIWGPSFLWTFPRLEHSNWLVYKISSVSVQSLPMCVHNSDHVNCPYYDIKG